MMTGTTAAVALVHGRTLTCANIGDSRIIVACQHDHKLVAVPLTRDHVPDCPIERTRIEQAGGRVESWSPDGIDTGPPRVWLKEKRLPGLSMSRAIGDDILRGILSSDAEVSRHELEEDDRFIVIATDGIWGVMSNEEVVSYVAGRGQEPCQSIAESLVRYAASLWYKDSSESIDDISVIVVRLNWN